MRRWQLGYRCGGLRGEAVYITPYTDLPEFESSYDDAIKHLVGLEDACPHLEWRLVQVIR